MSCECCCIDIKVVLEDETIDVHFEFGEPVDHLVKPDAYTGPVTITPTEERQTLQTSDKMMADNVIIEPIPDKYIVPTGSLGITENGQYDVTAKASVTVDVPTFIQLTQAEYDALPAKNPVTLYVIMEE